MIRLISYWILKILGWKIVFQVPKDLKACVLIGAPHTSNWDFIPSMAMAKMMGGRTKFVIKNEWLKSPIGFFFKSIGAIGVDRKLIEQNKTLSTTDLMADLFNQHQNLVLMISPEGTRKPNDKWKTGFYYIAQKANVPIVLGFADYEKKQFGLGAIIYPTDFSKDMHKIGEFYKEIKGKSPECFKLDKATSLANKE